VKEKSISHQAFWIILLVEAVIYLSLWLWNEYVASYISIILPSVILVLLILARIADWIEPSRLPSWYYRLMLFSILVPLVVGLVFYWIIGGRLEW
jgi:hypothetical protein